MLENHFLFLTKKKILEHNLLCVDVKKMKIVILIINKVNIFCLHNGMLASYEKIAHYHKLPWHEMDNLLRCVILCIISDNEQVKL